MPGIKTDGLAADVVEYLEGLEAQAETLTTQLGKSTEALTEANTAKEAAEAELAKAQKKKTTKKVDPDEDDEDADDDDDDEVQKALGTSPLLKSLFDAQRERIEKAEKQAADSETIAKAERDLRLTAEFTEIAKSMPTLVGTTPDKLGPLLKACAEKLDEQEYQALSAMLAATNGAMAMSKSIVDHEIGYTGAEYVGSEITKAAAADTSDEDALVKLAKAAKANPNEYEQQRRAALFGGQ